MKILIVDDVSPVRIKIKHYLTEIGDFQVDEAVSGRSALEMLKDDLSYNLVLMDWNMHDIDGLTALKVIRKTESLKEIPAIMCTSVSRKEDILTCIQEGATSYLLKPVSRETLQKSLSLHA